MVAKLLTSTLCVGYNCLTLYTLETHLLEVLNVLAVGPVGKSKQLPHRDPYLWIMPGVFMREIGFYLAQHLNFCLKNLYPFQQNFFPEQMVAWCQESNGTIPPSQLLQVWKDAPLHHSYYIYPNITFTLIVKWYFLNSHSWLPLFFRTS